MRTLPLLTPLLAIPLLAAAPPAPPAASTAPATSPAELALPTYGLTVTPPPANQGWQANPYPAPYDAAHWIFRDPFTSDIAAEIKISARWGDPLDRKNLASLAEGLGETLLPKDLLIDNNPAFAIKKDRTNDGTSPQLRLITCREGIVYTFLAIGRNADSPNRDLVALCKSVHWTPIDDPINHIDNPKSPLTILNGRATILMPTIFRSDITPGTVAADNQSYFAISDNKNHRPLIVLSISYHPSPAPDTPNNSDNRPALTAAPFSQLEPSSAPHIEGARASRLIENAQTHDGKTQTNYQRVIEIYLADGGFIRMVPAVLVTDPALVTKWDKILLDITQSIKLNVKSAPPASAPASPPPLDIPGATPLFPQ